MVRARQLLDSEAGNAAVEFAILCPLLVLLVAATVDLGLGFQQKLMVQAALNAGMQHVMQTQGGDLETSSKVIRHSIGLNTSAGIEINEICRCLSREAGCSAACQNGVDRFAAATVTRSYSSPIFGMETLLTGSFEVYLGRSR